MPPLLISLATGSMASETREELLQRAERSIEQEQFESGERVLVTTLQSAPADTGVLYRLGYVQYRQRKLEPGPAEFSRSFKARAARYRWQQNGDSLPGPAVHACNRFHAPLVGPWNVPKYLLGMENSVTAAAPFHVALGQRLTTNDPKTSL